MMQDTLLHQGKKAPFAKCSAFTGRMDLWEIQPDDSNKKKIRTVHASEGKLKKKPSLHSSKICTHLFEIGAEPWEKYFNCQ